MMLGVAVAVMAVNSLTLVAATEAQESVDPQSCRDVGSVLEV